MHHYYTYYPNVREIEIPDSNLIGSYAPLETPHGDREKILREAFDQPVNSLRLEEIATPEDRILIVLDDALEPTPTVFPFFHIVQALHKAKVPDHNVTVLLANSGHRASSNAEVDRKIGAEMRKKYKVYQSALNEREESFHTFGTAHTEHGPIAVRADARLKDASLIIGISGTYPNRFKGYTGGGSLVFPGLGDQDMIGQVYLSGAARPSAEILGHNETPARKLIRQLLEFVPAFKFCVDVLVDRTLTITACVTGTPGSVYRIGADVATRMTHFTLPERADIVVIDSHPFDANLFQATHALYAALGVLKPGGEIIVVSPLLEALSQHSANLAKSMSESRESLIRFSRTGSLSRTPVVGAQLAALREVADGASRVTFATHGAGMNDPALFGFSQSGDAQSALNGAVGRLGTSARIALISHGGLAVPAVREV
jgi:nickel-dependent lactate racemase